MAHVDFSVPHKMRLAGKHAIEEYFLSLGPFHGFPLDCTHEGSVLSESATF